MRIAAYEENGTERLGLVEGETIHPFPDGTSFFEALTDRDALGATARAGAGVQVASVRLLPPLHPASVRDFVSFE